MIIEINNEKQFNDIVADGTTLVDFFATWCGPCKMLSPVLHNLDETNQMPNIKIIKVDVDENMDIARKFNIQAVPTLILMKNGKISKVSAGYMNENDLLNFVK